MLACESPLGLPGYSAASTGLFGTSGKLEGIRVRFLAHFALPPYASKDTPQWRVFSTPWQAAL